MAVFAVCPNNGVQWSCGVIPSSQTATDGTVYPAGSQLCQARCFYSAVTTPTLINTNTLEQVAHPVMDAEDYSILSSAVVLGLVTAFVFRVVRTQIERIGS